MAEQERKHAKQTETTATNEYPYVETQSTLSLVTLII